MPAAARKASAAGPFAVEPELIAALNQVTLAALTSVPPPIIEQSLRKWIGANADLSKDELLRLIQLGAAQASAVHLFAPSLSGARPIDRIARAASAQGGYPARATAALAASRFRLFHVEAFGASGLVTARDCVTGAAFEMIDDSLSPILLEFDVASRLCPLAEGVFWAMGPLVPLGAHGQGLAARFPTRPGKGLINESNVAATLYREYVRAGAPLGVDFGLQKPEIVTLTYVDDELADYAEAMRDHADGPEPRGEFLARLRGLASLPRLAAALACTVQLAEGGASDGAAIYRVAARVFLEILCERARIGSMSATKPEELRPALNRCFGSKGMSAAVAAMLDTLLREVQPPEPQSRDGDLARVIERIRALRKKTVEQGCTEQEALIAADKVGELLERYGLSLSEIELRKQTCEGFGFDVGRKQSGPIDECFHAAAAFCDCRMWSEIDTAGKLRHVFFGLPADVEAARCLKDLIVAAFETETEGFKRGALFREADGAQRRALVKSFQFGLGGGVSRKLCDLKRAREAAASKSSGRDLMIVKRSIVEEELEKLGLSFQEKKNRGKRVITDAYEEGVAAAHRFEINEKLG